MKHAFHFALSLTFLLAVITSCQKAPELTITSPASIDLSADGSSGSITFMANRAWRVSSSDSWVTLSPSSGEPSETPVAVSVRCNANTTYEDRSATVTITMEELSQKVTVRQPANKGIVLPTQSYDLQSSAKTIEVTVQANVDYTVETSVDWIKQTGTKGLTSKTLNFSIEENKTYDAREGKITIKPTLAGVAEQVISVKQAQKDALIVEKTSYDMPFGGGEIEIKVEANVAFDVTPNVEWLHYVSTKALSSSTVLIKVDENATYSAREGKIEIAQQNGALKHTVTVKQAGRIEVTSVELDQTSLKLKPEETATLVATVKPDNATDKTVTWTSSDTSIATVDETGKVTAIKVGTATITAKAGEKSAECKVTIYIPVSSIVLNKTKLSLDIGESETLVATVKPDDATDKTITWTSSDETIATVDASGKIVAKKDGSTTITAQAGVITASCEVVVCIPVSSITLNETKLELMRLEARALNATIEPENATKKDVVWSSSDLSVAQVRDDGYVYAKGAGTAIITAKAGSKSVECSVKVEEIPDNAIDLGIELKREDGGTYVVLYRTSNLGANAPEEYGDFYAWGETETKSDYSWTTYKWGNGSPEMYTKYCPIEASEHWAGSGDPDNKTELDPEDDAVRLLLGGRWRTPSNVEMLALEYRSNWDWTTRNGVKGYKVWARVDDEYRSIFLPAAGSRKGTDPYREGYTGLYWTSSLSPESPKAIYIIFQSFSKDFSGESRYYGYTIRPVIELHRDPEPQSGS